MFSGVLQDVRYGLTILRRNPGFAALAISSLALGIGATTALHGAARVALLDELPVPRPHELRLVLWSAGRDLPVSQYNSGSYTDPASNVSYRTNYSYPVFRALLASDPDRLFGFNFLTRLTLAVDRQPPSAVTGLLVYGNAFDVLEPPIALGRGLTRQDDEPGAAPVAVLTAEGWRGMFGADPDVVGTPVRINGSTFTIAGVTADGFRGLSTGGGNTPLAQVILPLAAQPLVWTGDGGPSFTATGVLWVRVMARVQDDSVQRTSEQLAAVLRGAYVATGVLTEPGAVELTALLRPGRRGVDPIGPFAERPLRILSTVVAVVVLIACVNIAALLLARGVGRRREIALRAALGAGRGRLVRQLAVEGAVLAVFGGAAGLLVAAWTRPLVASMLTTGLNLPPTSLGFDWETVGVAFAATAVTVAVFGLLPAIRLTGGNLIGRLRQHMIAASAPRPGLGRALLALQIAASVPLVVLSLLLIRTIANLNAVDVGFDPNGLLIVRADPTIGRGPRTGSDPAFDESQVRRLLERVEAIPGVISATLIENPLLSGILSDNWVYVDGQKGSMLMNGIGPKYFETLGITLRAGRAPDARDRAEGPRVAVINETAARRYFGAGSPVGRRFTMGRRSYEVIGVAADSKYTSLRAEAAPTMMDPFVQRAAGGPLNVVIRARALDEALQQAVRAAVTDVLPDVPIAQIRTQVDQIGRAMGRERLLAQLLGFFAAFVLLLASVGLYSASSYAVARRTSEIGVRMALGARRSQVTWMVIRSSLVLSAVGLAAGSIAAWFAGPLVGALLFGLPSHDAPTLLLAAMVMLAVAVAAAAVPASRASRIDPLVALRRE